MEKLLFTYQNNIFLILLYSLFLLVIAIKKFKKNSDDNPIFTCENLYIILFYIFLAIGPIFSFLIGIKYEYNYNVFFLFAFSLLLFLIGADVIVGNKIFTFKKNNSIPKKEIAINWDNIRANSKIVLYVSYLFAAIYLFKNLSFILQNVDSNRVTAMSGNGVMIYISYAMLPATWILYYCHLNDRKVKNIWIYILIDILLLTLFGFRSRVIELVLMCVILRNDYQKIKIKKLLKLGAVLILIAASLQVLRSITSNYQMGILKSLNNTLSVASINLIYIFNAFPKKIPFQNGYTYAINFLQLLPSHHLDVTMWLKNILNMRFSGGGMTPTVIGEFYINFGIAGIIIGMIGSGIFCRFLDNYYKKNSSRKNKIIYFILMFYIARSVASGYSNFIIIMLWFIAITIGIYRIKIISKR